MRKVELCSKLFCGSLSDYCTGCASNWWKGNISYYVTLTRMVEIICPKGVVEDQQFNSNLTRAPRIVSLCHGECFCFVIPLLFMSLEISVHRKLKIFEVMCHKINKNYFRNSYKLTHVFVKCSYLYILESSLPSFLVSQSTVRDLAIKIWVTVEFRILPPLLVRSSSLLSSN